MGKRLSIILILSIVIAMAFSLTGCRGDNGGGSGFKPRPDPLPEEPITEVTLSYNYNEATACNTEENIVIKKENYKEETLVVPVREGYDFVGWYADWTFNTKVADEQGILEIGDEFFDKKSKDIFAKWKNDSAPVYPILMVFVTEVDAVLKDNDENDVIVKYTMSASERKVFEILAPMLEQYLDAMLNGAVDFKVDTFFTTKVVGTRSFTQGMTHGLGSLDLVYDYTIAAWNLPELGGMEWPERDGLPPLSEIEGDGILSKYKSIITTFNMNDYNYLLHVTAGVGGRKYASIHMENMFYSLIQQVGSIDYIFNLNNQGAIDWWEAYLQLYLHEFTHTVESYAENEIVNYGIDYHDAYGYYAKNNLIGKLPSGIFNEFEFIQKYLLYRVEIDGRTLGIPPSFWLM